MTMATTEVDKFPTMGHRAPSREGEFNEKSSSVEDGPLEKEEKYDDHDVYMINLPSFM